MCSLILKFSLTLFLKVGFAGYSSLSNFLSQQSKSVFGSCKKASISHDYFINTDDHEKVWPLYQTNLSHFKFSNIGLDFVTLGSPKITLIQQSVTSKRWTLLKHNNFTIKNKSSSSWKDTFIWNEYWFAIELKFYFE